MLYTNNMFKELCDITFLVLNYCLRRRRFLATTKYCIKENVLCNVNDVKESLRKNKTFDAMKFHYLNFYCNNYYKNLRFESRKIHDSSSHVQKQFNANFSTSTKFNEINSKNKENVNEKNEMNTSSNEDLMKLKKSENILTIPNLLCVIRITLSPVLCYFIIVNELKTAGAILIFAGLTDFVDGLIARRFKSQYSQFGSFIDPLADKILMMTLYVTLAYTQMIPLILMGSIILRDVLLILAGSYIRYISIPKPRTVKKFFDSSYSNAKLSPTGLSKINTAIQIVTAFISLYAPICDFITDVVLLNTWYIAGFSTLISGISYLFAKNTYTILKKT